MSMNFNDEFVLTSPILNANQPRSNVSGTSETSKNLNEDDNNGPVFGEHNYFSNGEPVEGFNGQSSPPEKRRRWSSSSASTLSALAPSSKSTLTVLSPSSASTLSALSPPSFENDPSTLNPGCIENQQELVSSYTAIKSESRSPSVEHHVAVSTTNASNEKSAQQQSKRGKLVRLFRQIGAPEEPVVSSLPEQIPHVAHKIRVSDQPKKQNAVEKKTNVIPGSVGKMVKQEITEQNGLIMKSKPKTVKNRLPASADIVKSVKNFQKSEPETFSVKDLKMKELMSTNSNNLWARGKTLCPQVIEIIRNVRNFFQEERSRHRLLVPVVNVRERICEATGLSQQTLNDILSSEKSSQITKEVKKRVRRKSKDSIPHKSGLFLVLNRLIAENNEISIQTLSDTLWNDAKFYCSINTLWNRLKNHGYYYQKIGEKLFVYQSKRIVDWQVSYLRQMKQFRHENRPIFYLDDTWFGQSGYGAKNSNSLWRKLNGIDTETVKSEVEKKPEPSQNKQVKRLFVAHIGNENGFVNGAACMFIVKKSQNEWDGESFEHWFQEEVLPRLPLNSVVIMNNARWHLRRKYKCPMNGAHKKEMIAWLECNGIDYDPDLDKKDLYNDYILPNKERYQTYLVDEMASERNCTVLRLPPLHSELNPLSTIWPTIKERSTINYTHTFDMNKYIANVAEELTRFSGDEWKRAVDQVVKLEEMYYPDLISENSTKSLVVSLNNEEGGDLEVKMEESDDDNEPLQYFKNNFDVGDIKHEIESPDDSNDFLESMDVDTVSQK